MKMVLSARWSELIREVPVKKGDFIPIDRKQIFYADAKRTFPIQKKIHCHHAAGQSCQIQGERGSDDIKV